jgi:hypothetical protein
MYDISACLKFRANTISDWASTDTPENYKEFHEHYNAPNLYKPKDFTYKYNDYGFRCDDFSLPTDINIVFLGCSITEGVGLPLEQTWSSLLLSKIQQKTNKNITHQSLAIGGSGLDAAASNLHWFNKLKKTDYIFALFPALTRRDYTYGSNSMQCWHTTRGNLALGKLFIDEYYQYSQNYRSLALIESIAFNGPIMYCTCWDQTNATNIFNLNNFSSLNYFPHDIKDKEFARDGMHPGPSFHITLSDLFWNKIEHLF